MHGKREKLLLCVFRVKKLYYLSLSDRHDQSGNELLRTFVEHFEIRGSSEGIGGHRSNRSEDFLDGRRTGIKDRGTVEQRAV